MSSPSPDAPLVPSEGGPLLEGPSPGWARAAQGLRWMRLAMYSWVYGWVAGYGLWALALVGGESTGPAGFVVGYLAWAMYLVAHVAFGAGLWRFGSVPASTGAARPARQSFACFASGVVLLLLVILLFAWSAHALSSPDYPVSGYVLLLFSIAPSALNVTCVGLLVRALGATLRSLGETPPAWAPKAFGALVAWSILSIALLGSMSFIPSGAPDLMWVMFLVWGLAVVGGCAFALALASVMGRTAGVLARQERSETGPR